MDAANVCHISILDKNDLYRVSELDGVEIVMDLSKKPIAGRSLDSGRPTWACFSEIIGCLDTCVALCYMQIRFVHLEFARAGPIHPNRRQHV